MATQEIPKVYINIPNEYDALYNALKDGAPPNMPEGYGEDLLMRYYTDIVVWIMGANATLPLDPESCIENIRRVPMSVSVPQKARLGDLAAWITENPSNYPQKWRVWADMEHCLRMKEKAGP